MWYVTYEQFHERSKEKTVFHLQNRNWNIKKLEKDKRKKGSIGVFLMKLAENYPLQPFSFLYSLFICSEKVLQFHG